MLKSLKLAVPAVIAGLGMIVATSNVSYGTAKISKDTGVKACTACHVGIGKKELNKAGDCYKAKKDLKACNIPVPAPAN